MARQVRPGPPTLFDECKAVLSRLGLYRTGVPDDHHMDQYNKPHSATRANEKGAGDELAMLAAGMSISPPETASPEDLDEGMRLVEDPTDPGTLVVNLDHAKKDQQLSQDTIQPSGTPPLSAPQLLLPCGPVQPYNFSGGGESMHSSASQSSWDAAVEAHSRRRRNTAATTSTLNSVLEMPGPGDAIEPIKTPVTSPGPQGQKPASVLMYVHATGEPVDLAELERAAVLVRSPGVDPPVATAQDTATTLSNRAQAGLLQPLHSGAIAAGVKRQHADVFEPRSPAVTRSAGGCTPPQPRSNGTSAGGMISPTHMSMRRNTRPAFVPRLNLALLPAGECESPYGQRGTSLPKLPDSMCRCLDLAEEERKELESWTLAPKWQPPTEGRHYVFKPVNTQEVHRYERLRAAVPLHLAGEVDQMWKELIQARYACELMASRGVRVVKDVTREWSEMSSHLIQRIETHEATASSMQAYCQQQATLIQQLSYQLKVMQAQAAAAATAGYPPQHMLTPQGVAPAHMKMGYDFGQFPGYQGYDPGAISGAVTAPSGMRPSRRADRGGAHGGLS